MNNELCNYFVGMLDVDTEPKFLQYSPLSFDNLIFQIYVVLVRNQRRDWSEKNKKSIVSIERITPIGK